MISLWNVVVIRDPVVLACMLFFGCLSLGVNPHVLVEVVDCWLEVLNMCNMCWNVHVVVSGSEVSLALLEAMAVCIGIIVLVVGVLVVFLVEVAQLTREIVIASLKVILEVQHPAPGLEYKGGFTLRQFCEISLGRY